uniref:UBC core domain-containing protein n=1 Tax=Chelydra serpentina TaxID=8475 RepID=A0A8C3TDP2_CHESE
MPYSSPAVTWHIEYLFWAVLQLSMKYTEEYNSVPPTVTFNTIPFHPNVDQHSGRPCIDFLDNPKEWNGKLTMSSILLTIQVMLSNPELENVLNVEAAEMLKNNISLYRQMVIQCVRTSQHLEETLLCIYIFRRITTVSFEDYHRMWSGIATSKAAEHFKAPCKMIWYVYTTRLIQRVAIDLLGSIYRVSSRCDKLIPESTGEPACCVWTHGKCF